jgi:hypothetical protein
MDGLNATHHDAHRLACLMALRAARFLPVDAQRGAFHKEAQGFLKQVRLRMNPDC